MSETTTTNTRPKRGPKPQDKALKAFEAVTKAMQDVPPEERARVIATVIHFLRINLADELAADVPNGKEGA